MKLLDSPRVMGVLAIVQIVGSFAFMRSESKLEVGLGILIALSGFGYLFTAVRKMRIPPTR